MIMKIVGMVLVFSSMVLGGVYYGNLDGYRISDLMELKRALAILKSEIEFANSPLGEALANISKRTSKEIGGIFATFAQHLKEERGADVLELWEKSVNSCAKDTYLNKEDLEVLISFGKTLGYLDKGMQLSNIAMVTNYIDEKVVALNETRYKNKKLFLTLGFLLGVLVLILFM